MLFLNLLKEERKTNKQDGPPWNDMDGHRQYYERLLSSIYAAK